MDPAPNDPKLTPTRRSKGPRIVVAIALLLGLIAATPALLSTGFGGAILARLIKNRLGIPATFASASVRWAGPITLREVSVPSPDAFGPSTMATAAEVRLDTSFGSLLAGSQPDGIAVDELFLELIENTNGESNLGQTLKPLRSSDGPPLGGQPLALSVENAAIRITRAANPSTPMTLSPATLSLDIGSNGIVSTMAFSAEIQGGAEPSSFQVAFFREPTEAQSTKTSTIEVSAENTQLGALQPLVRAFYPGAVIAGIAQGTARIQRSAASLEMNADATLTSFEIAGTPLHPLAARDNRVRLAGSASIDFSAQEARFDGFKIASSSFGIDANGHIKMTPNGFVGDVILSGSMDFIRTAKRIAPALAWIPSGYRFGGDILFELALQEDGRLAASIDGEGGSFSPPGAAAVGLGDWSAKGLIAVAPAQQMITFDECIIETFAGTLGGNVRVHDVERTPREFGGDVRFTGDSSKLLKILSPWVAGLPMGLVGQAEFEVSGNAGPDEAHFRATIVSDDLDLRVDHDTPEISDLYWVRSAPLNAELDIRWPRGGDFIRDLSATLRAHADETWIRLDPMQQVNAQVTMDAGIVHIEQLTMMGYDGGTLSAIGSLSFAESPPTIDVDAQLNGVLLKGLLLDHVARPIPVFAAKPNPTSMETTCRGDATIQLHATGNSMTEWFRTMVGKAEVSIGPGTITGSPLLAALQHTTDAVRCDRLSATVALTPGSLRSEAQIEVTGRRPIRLIGAASPAGSLEFLIPPEDIIPPNALPNLDDVLTADLFPVRGRITDPIIRLPEQAFYELDEPMKIREYIRNIRTP